METSAHMVAAALGAAMAAGGLWLAWLSRKAPAMRPVRQVRLAGALFALATGVLILLLVAEYCGLARGSELAEWHGLVTAAATLAVFLAAASGAALLLVERWAVASLHGRLTSLSHAARHDQLTGLLHQGALFSAMAAAVAVPGRALGVIMLDMDRFKDLNDQHGHLAGDAALARVGEYLKGAAGPGAMVARYGGDEFCIVLPDAPCGKAVALAQQLVAGLGRIEAAEPLGGSAGVAWGLTGSHSFTDFVAAADRALYRAKAVGGGRVEVEWLGQSPDTAAPTPPAGDPGRGGRKTCRTFLCRK